MVQSDIAPQYWLKYKEIRVGKPYRTEGGSQVKVTPMECRLTDSTYSAHITVDIEHAGENGIRKAKNIVIGKIPIMLRSKLCHLSSAKSDKAMAKLGECPLDPGGYFVVKGTEKVILVQEQLSKNRIIVMTDSKKDIVTAEVTS